MKIKSVALIVFASLALLLPFVTRPLFVDDRAHFVEALALPGHWTAPYMGAARTPGWKMHGSSAEANPPLYFYLMAAFARVAGPQIWKAHLLIIAFTIAGVLAFYSLAQPYTRYPEWAALLWLTSPHVWLTANSLLIDSLAAPFLLIGLAFWIKGWREQKFFFSGAGAIFLGLAPLVKYSGWLGVFLAVAWVIFEAREKMSWRWLWLGISLGILGSWIFWAARHTDVVPPVKLGRLSWPHVITLAVFAIATTPVMALGAAAFLFRGPRSLRAASWCLFIAFVAFGFITGYKLSTGLQLSVWTAVFAIWVLSVTPEENKFWLSEGFLLTWAFGGLAEIACGIRWVCGRFLVVASPAWVLLSVRTLERRCPEWIASRNVRGGILAALIFLSAGMAISDWRQASAEENAAARAEAWRLQTIPKQTAFYPAAALGGLSFYLPEDHWQALTPGQRLAKGSVVFLPTRTLPPIFWPRLTKPRLLSQWVYPFIFPLRTFDAVGGAGYYGSMWGPLPYSFSTAPLEVYLLVQCG